MGVKADAIRAAVLGKEVRENIAKGIEVVENFTATENARNASETARIGAETARTGAETSRVAVEIQRTIDDLARTDAESARATDYASLQGIMIDENNAVNLQNQVNEHTVDLAEKRDKGTAIKGSDIDITSDANKIGLNQLTDETKATMAGTTPVNAIPAPRSINESHIALGGVDAANLGPTSLSKISLLANDTNTLMEIKRNRHGKIVNKIDQLNGSTIPSTAGLTIEFVDNDGTGPFTPAQVPKMIRETHTVEASLCYTSFGPFSCVDTEKGLKWGVWIRKSDILAAPYSLPIDALVMYQGGAIPSIFTGKISSIELCVVGTKISKTENGITIKFEVMAEVNGWIYWQGSTDKQPAGNQTAYVYFRINAGLRTVGKIDKMLMTATNMEDDLIPGFVYPANENDFRLSPSETAMHRRNIDAQMRLKYTLEPSLKELNVVTEKINAINMRFNDTTESLKAYSSESAYPTKCVYNDDAFADFGELNAIAIDCPNGIKYKPATYYYANESDLASIGVVASDTAPPVISMKGSFIKSTMINQKISAIQVFFILRYGLAVGSGVYSASKDVLFNTVSTPLGYLVTGDTTTWAGNTATGTDDGIYWSVKRENVIIPKTYKGLEFKGVMVIMLPYPTVEGTGNTSYYETCNVAIVKGNTIDIDESYLNPGEGIKLVIKENDISEPLMARINEASGGARVNQINIKNSDKIVLLGDSYTASHYTLKDKAYISNLGMLSDWRFENFGKSGDDYAEILDRVRNNINPYHNIGIRDMGMKYAVLISWTNDTYWRGVDQAFYYSNIRDLADAVKQLGGMPIIATEFCTSNNMDLVGIKKIADDNGWPFLDLVTNDYKFDTSHYAPFWGGGHPATRTNGLFYDTMLKYLDNLPRPKQSIKIFRKRVGFTIVNSDDLLYDNIPQRAKAWRELSVGHYALKAGVQDKYFDALNDVPDLAYQYDLITSEYLMLQNKETLNFLDYALVEVILPTTRNNLDNLTFHISNDTTKVYCRNYFSTTKNFNGYGKYQGFYYSGAQPTANPGAIYTSSNISGDFTVLGFRNGMIIMSSQTLAYSAAAGTLTKTSGTGDTSISYTKASYAFPLEWYDQYTAKGEGTWTELVGSLGNYVIPNASIKDFVNYDKVEFLIYKAGGFDINDIYVNWEGNEEKIYIQKPWPKESRNAELLTATKMGDSTQLAGWTKIGVMTPYTPIDGVLPIGTIGCIDITPAIRLQQTINVGDEAEVLRTLQIKIWARVFPTIFAPTSVYPTESLITSDTYDLETLKVTMTNGTALTFDNEVGLHWREIIINTAIPVTTTSIPMEIYSMGKNIQIARVSAKILD